jgi:glycopeptide antibiotics resistance protein
LLLRGLRKRLIEIRILSMALKLKKKTIYKLERTLLISLFSVYSFFMGKLLFIRPREVYKNLSPNFTPFETIERYIMNYEYFNFDIWFNNLFGNVIAFIPLGALLPLILKKKSNKDIILYFFLIIVSIEVTQITFGVGRFDIDDIILNFFGGMIGFLLIFFSTKMKKNKK